MRKTLLKNTICAVGFLIAFGTLFTVINHRAFAQERQFNIATTLTIKDTDAVDGDVMSLSTENETLVRSKKAYDERMYGVLVASPVMVYRTKSTLAVTRSGEAYVNITTLGGPIKVGDYITSSEIPGKGQKAGETTGYMIGISLMNFTDKEGAPFDWNRTRLSQGQVKVAIGIGPASPVIIKAAGGIFGTLQQLAQAVIYNIGTSRQFERMIRYLLAALIALVAIIISYLTFGRNVTKGIEAIGRNPLAKVSIQTMIIINVILIFVVCLGGVLLALVIISL